jgi:hypothetical protein
LFRTIANTPEASSELSETPPPPPDQEASEPLGPFGQLIAEAIGKRGLSLREAAAAVTEAAWEADQKKTTVHPSTVHGWMHGHVAQPSMRRWIALGLNVPLEDVNTAAKASSSGDLRRHGATVPKQIRTDVELPAAIKASQDEWRRVRRHLAENRSTLIKLAADLYKHTIKVGSAPALAGEGWMASTPFELGSLKLTWHERPQRRVVDGAEPEARLSLPLRAPGQQFERYSSAMRYVDRPRLFENRPTYRLLGVDLAGDPPSLSYSLSTYFDMVDVGQALSHEIAAAHMRWGTRVSLDRLPFRALVGDPLDLRRRLAQSAINALTIRWDARAGKGTFMLHWRDPAKVAVGGGLYSVAPVGVFQPSTVAPYDKGEDFDLWRNLIREFSEEFLGMPEHDGNGSAPIDYEMWPLYRTLTQARANGALRIVCFGLTLDPLWLGADILTAVVIDSELFDELFIEIGAVNEEGYILVRDGQTPAAGFPFVQGEVDRFLKAEPMGPGGSAALALAWQHRDTLLET